MKKNIWGKRERGKGEEGSGVCVGEGVCGW
jgi:hypothetical protein